MIIGIATENNRVSEHFGNCQGFTLVDIQDGKVVSRGFIDNPVYNEDHNPGFLQDFLKNRGVELVIVSGMGQRAIDLFKEEGIEIILGASGTIDKVIDTYIDGSLDLDQPIIVSGYRKGYGNRCGSREGHRKGYGSRCGSREGHRQGYGSRCGSREGHRHREECYR